MSEARVETAADSLEVRYAGAQRCAARRPARGRPVTLDACAGAGGRGEELSPGDLVGAGLAGCMLFAMGVVARRQGLDIAGTRAEVEVSMGPERIRAIELTVELPDRFTHDERQKLERATGLCPIKSSFHPDIPITARFEYRGHEKSEPGSTGREADRTASNCGCSA